MNKYINFKNNNSKDMRGDDDLFTYISLFSGAGIGCYGFKQNNFKCIATCELLEKRIQFQRYNQNCNSEEHYIVGDLTTQETKQKIFSLIKKNKTNDIDVIIATPPCQGMSVANHKKKNETKRNSLVVESIKIIKGIKPKFFIFENVKAFLNTECLDVDGKNKSIKDSIENNLSGNYNILSNVINFKNYGVPSSRNRTLVIGVRKDLEDITPFDIFPDKKKEINLRKVIGNLPRLKEFGEISEEDLLHNFREYDPIMMNWIKDIKEGQSAFDNEDINKRPHRIIDGNIIHNQNKNGDKYSRCYWDKPAPCIHTRNDILSSQSTVHPVDNRVFSIRELMEVMSIPKSFNWFDIPEKTLNKLNKKDKKAILSINDLNIRKSIGEAVPTKIFYNMAKKIKKIQNKNKLSKNQINNLIKQHSLDDPKKLLDFIKSNKKKYNFIEFSKICELSNSQRTNNSAYYTGPDTCYGIVNDLPEYKNIATLNILEPSVGNGNFLPQLIKKYENVSKVNIDVVDIDKNTLESLKESINLLKIPKNIKINFINDDFLLHNFDKKYDIVVGNPPFKKIIKNKPLLKKYKVGVYNKDTNNIFSFFIEKSLNLGDFVALITPKSLLSTPELNKTREILHKRGIVKITDYGEKAFDVKIETISFITSKKKNKRFLNIKNPKINVKIESRITKETQYMDSDYIFSNEFPYWLIYRNKFFDDISNNIDLGIFEVFRDRQITKKITKSTGKYRVLKSRNLLKDGEIKNLKNYDSYVDDLSKLVISKFINKNKVIIAPNLSYYPRAGFLPKNSITDGSLALLIPKDNKMSVTKEKLKYFSTKEFERFYKIARNHGTRSLNIDKNSVFFWGLLKNNGK
jgi:DNA (cytosine-5)-methyltransferase 1